MHNVSQGEGFCIALNKYSLDYDLETTGTCENTFLKLELKETFQLSYLFNFISFMFVFRKFFSLGLPCH